MARARRPRPDRQPPEAEAALEIAARYLATRPRSRREVELRLRRAGADETVVETTLSRLEALGYVDDAAFVRWWGEQRDRHSPRGRRMVEAELRQRGIRGEAIETFRAGWEAPDRAPGDEQLPGTEADRAALALARHLRGRPLPDDRAGLARIGMYLVRRGFDPETARAAIRAAGRPAAESDDADDATHG